MWLVAGAAGIVFGGVGGAGGAAGGGAGGAAGGGGKELVAEGGGGFGATLIGVVFWFRFWFSFCARDADDVVGLPPKPDLGATAGALAEFGAELL